MRKLAFIMALATVVTLLPTAQKAEASMAVSNGRVYGLRPPSNFFAFIGQAFICVVTAPICLFEEDGQQRLLTKEEFYQGLIDSSYPAAVAVSLTDEYGRFLVEAPQFEAYQEGTNHEAYLRRQVPWASDNFVHHALGL